MTNSDPKFRVVDNPSVITTYADKLVGSTFDGSAITLTLGVIGMLPRNTGDVPAQGDKPHVNVNGRLAISPALAIEIVNTLNQMLGVIAANPNHNKIVPVPPKGPQGPQAH